MTEKAQIRHRSAVGNPTYQQPLIQLAEVLANISTLYLDS